MAPSPARWLREKVPEGGDWGGSVSGSSCRDPSWLTSLSLTAGHYIGEFGPSFSGKSSEKERPTPLVRSRPSWSRAKPSSRARSYGSVTTRLPRVRFLVAFGLT